MRKIGVLLVVALLVGCATMDDMRSKKVVFELSSNKSPKELAICIAKQWEKVPTPFLLAKLPIDIHLKYDGYSVTATGQNAIGVTSVMALADITETGSASSIKYYTDGSARNVRYQESISPCLQ